MSILTVNVSPEDYGKITVEDILINEYPAASAHRNSAEVRLVAIPNPGYNFESWSGNLSSTANPLTLLLDCDKTITAHFSAGASTEPTAATPGFRLPFDGWIIASLALAVVLVFVLVIRRRET